MQIGMIGLGRMGGNIVRRLATKNHSCVVYDRAQDAIDALVKEGSKPAKSPEDMVKQLPKPRVVWVMLPSGKITDDTVTLLGSVMEKGDIIIDGGNSFWQDDIRRAKALAAKGIHYVDIGTSGGVWGKDRGYCMMIGGSKEAVTHLDPILDTLAPGIGTIDRTRGRSKSADSRVERGYMHCGPSGAGHFVKMVHNGIEYGMMQAYAEGFDIMKNAASDKLPVDHRIDLNVGDIADALLQVLLAAAAARAAGEEPMRVHTAYDAARRRLKIVALGGLAASAELLRTVEAALRERADQRLPRRPLPAPSANT